MKCPVCNTTDLVMSERQGIEIDYCPNCRGIWLDRGELDKILERSQQAPAQSSSRPAPEPRYDKGHYDQGHYRKKNWLNELFD